MDFFTTLRILLSRWYVVVPSLLFTLAAAVGASAAVAPSWKATGTLVLLSPATVRSPTDAAQPRVQTNAYLEFGGALERTAEIVSRIMMSPATADQLAARGLTAEYEVGTGSDGGSPIINIIATGPDPEIAKATVQGVAGQIRGELQRRQSAAGAPKEDFIRVDQVTTPTSAERQLGSKMRAAAAAGALGLALTFGLAFLTESIAERRAAKRQDQGPGVSGAGPPREGTPGSARRAGQRAAARGASGQATAATASGAARAGQGVPPRAPGRPAPGAGGGRKPGGDPVARPATRRVDVFAAARRNRAAVASGNGKPAATAGEQPAAESAKPQLLQPGDRTEPLPAISDEEMQGLLGAISRRPARRPGAPTERAAEKDIWAARNVRGTADRIDGGEAGTRPPGAGGR